MTDRLYAGSSAILAATTALSIVLPGLSYAQESYGQTKGSSVLIQTLDPVVVIGQGDAQPQIQLIAPDSATGFVPAADGGEFLRSVPGISGSRMGGHGIDPVIRGQQGNQLNILSNGAQVHGGCPNRMDPPSAYIATETYDRIEVTQGYHSVIGAAGGPGGTVSFERTVPSLTEDKPYRIRAGGGYDSNGVVRDAYADVAAGAQGFFARGIANTKQANNYEDGSEGDVRSAFDEKSGDLILGYAQNGREVELGYAYERIDDALFAGAGMDSPLSKDHTVKGRFTLPAENAGALVEIRGQGYFGGVDHKMDNYTLRDRTAAMAMRVDSTSDSQGLQLEGDLKVGDQLVTIGVNYQSNDREAVRYSGASDDNVDTLHSLLWPDAEISQIGLGAETTFDLRRETRLTTGLRYDRTVATAGRADETVVSRGRSPNDLYNSYYGATATERTENEVGGLVRLEQDLSDNTVIFTGLSRSIRTADATERFMASDAGTDSWVGNPSLAPEKHHQLEIGARTGKPLSQAEAKGEKCPEPGVRTISTAYVDRVQDYILRDTARGQDGIAQTNGASVYHNVDAVLAGATVGVDYVVDPH